MWDLFASAFVPPVQSYKAATRFSVACGIIVRVPFIENCIDLE